MKYILNLIFFVVAFAQVIAQHTVNEAYYPAFNFELNYIYNDYDNKIAYSAPNHFDTILIETIPASSVTYYQANIVKVNVGRMANREISIIVQGVKNNDTILISRNEFSVKTLPKPNLYLGYVTIYGQGSFDSTSSLERIFNSNILLSKYPPEIPINEDFKIIEWEIIVDIVPFKGKGNRITEEVSEAIYNSPKGSVIKIKSATVKSLYKEFKLDVSLDLHKTSEIRTFKLPD